jgi:hypothetical protein
MDFFGPSFAAKPSSSFERGMNPIEKPLRSVSNAGFSFADLPGNQPGVWPEIFGLGQHSGLRPKNCTRTARMPVPAGKAGAIGR